MVDLTATDSGWNRGLLRNSVINILGQVVPILVGIFSLPFIVRGLGADRFGILALVWGTLAYLGILGLGRATTNFVGVALGEGRQERIRAVAGTATLIQGGFGIAAMLVLLMLTRTLVEDILRVPAGLISEASGAFYALAASVPVVMFSNSLRGILEAAQRFDLVNAVKVPLTSAYFLMPLLGVLVGWDLPVVVLMIVAALAASAVAQYLLCVRVFPSLRGVPRLEMATLRPLLRYGGWVVVSGLVAPVLVLFDRFMIGALFSVAAIAYYAAPYEIVARIWVVAASGIATLFPVFSTLGWERRRQSLERLGASSIRYVLVFLGPLVVSIVGFAPDIIRLALGSGFAQRSTIPFQLFAVGGLIFSLGFVPFLLLQAIGRPDIPAKLHIVEVPFHLILLFVLIKTWGVNGAALAWVLRVSVDLLVFSLASTRLSALSLRSLIPRASERFGIILLLLGASAAAFSTLESPVPRSIGVGLVTVGAVALAWQQLSNDEPQTRLAEVADPPGGS